MVKLEGGAEWGVNLVSGMEGREVDLEKVNYSKSLKFDLVEISVTQKLFSFKTLNISDIFRGTATVEWSRALVAVLEVCGLNLALSIHFF